MFVFFLISFQEPESQITNIALPSYSDTFAPEASAASVSYGWWLIFRYSFGCQHGTTPGMTVSFNLPDVNGEYVYDFDNASVEVQGRNIEFERQPTVSGNSSM